MTKLEKSKIRKSLHRRLTKAGIRRTKDGNHLGLRKRREIAKQQGIKL